QLLEQADHVELAQSVRASQRQRLVPEGGDFQSRYREARHVEEGHPVDRLLPVTQDAGLAMHRVESQGGAQPDFHEVERLEDGVRHLTLLDGALDGALRPLQSAVDMQRSERHVDEMVDPCIAGGVDQSEVSLFVDRLDRVAWLSRERRAGRADYGAHAVTRGCQRVWRLEIPNYRFGTLLSQGGLDG